MNIITHKNEPNLSFFDPAPLHHNLLRPGALHILPINHSIILSIKAATTEVDYFNYTIPTSIRTASAIFYIRNAQYSNVLMVVNTTPINITLSRQ